MRLHKGRCVSVCVLLIALFVFSVMALAGAFLCEDQFTCSICLEVFENPVSTPCGHSFCQRCISSYWDGGRGGSRVYLCPICKESFRKRPELHINRTLKEITEQFKHIASAGGPAEGGDGGGLGRGLGKDSVSQSHLTLTQRPGEMPESVIAEMMTRFQRMPPPAGPHGPGSVQHPVGPVGPVPPLVADNTHGDLPPPYHAPPPRRYTLRSSFQARFMLTRGSVYPECSLLSGSL